MIKNTDNKELRLYNNRLFGKNKKITNNIKLVDNQAPRYIDKTGREFIEIPAIILGNTVIEGNGGYEFGQELISKRALQSHIDQWNDKPVVIYHTDGSARDIDNLVEEKVGYMFNTEMTGYDDEPMNARLKVMLRLDVELLELHEDGQFIIDTFDSGEMMEMSTGYWLYDWIYEEGTHNGKEFFGIQLEIMPDHLALLPNAEGAYNEKDGGGANRYNTKGETMNDKDKTEVKELLNSVLEEKSIPTKDDIGEMVGNAVEEKMKDVNNSLSSIQSGLDKIAEKKEVDDDDIQNQQKADDKERKNLIAKVKEKTTDYSDEVLNDTPNEVLEGMLKNATVSTIGRPILENTEVKPLGYGQKKEEDKK